MTRFDKIYEKERWGKGKGSGDGSHPVYCEAYLGYVASLLKSGQYASVLDVGCGDWQASRLLDWSGHWYLGVDVVQSILPARSERHPSVRFQIADVTVPGTLTKLFEIRSWELVLVKDVMQHWSDEEVTQFVAEILALQWKTLLVVNDWRFTRSPSKNGSPRNIKNSYSWAPIPYDHPTLLPLSLQMIGYYPFNKRKQISRVDHGL